VGVEADLKVRLDKVRLYRSACTSRSYVSIRLLPTADVRVLYESRSAHAQEHEVFVADVGDALRHVCRNLYDVTLADDGWRQVADFHSSFAANDDVTLDDAFESMPCGGHTRTHARPRN